MAENVEIVSPLQLKSNLTGLAKLHEGDYRIIYETIRVEEIIVSHFVEHRSAIYKGK